MTGPRLSIIPARAATDPALKPRDLQVLCVLGRHTDDLGWCRKSQVKMAEEMGCARSTVFEAVERLVRAGYLERYVQESENGRDSPHVYRVILDPKHPDPAAVEDADSVSDSSGKDPCRPVGTPAGISAPPAGPEPAPPAGPGPAPKNDPFRTTDSEREERERGREDDPKRIERDGWALLKNWPGFDGMPKEPAMKVWRRLEADDRAAARRRFLPWLELLRRQKKTHVPAPSTYLTERLWEAVADPDDRPAALEAAPFGKLWMAERLAELLGAPGGPLARLTAFEQAMVADGKADEAALMREKQARSGWPSVNAMHERASYGKGVTVRPERQALAALMARVHVSEPVFARWRDEHAARGWPWLPDMGRQEWVYFPEGGPAGMAAFEDAVRQAQDEGTGEAGKPDRASAARGAAAKDMTGREAAE